MSFLVAAAAYDRFMGRYSALLSAPLCEQAGVRDGQRALDVGCGPGALTAELVARLGPAAVCAVDPSRPFVEAARERYPGVDVRRASAEHLPFRDGTFDLALAQLVVHFMADPLVGITEMRRVTRHGGALAACVWDHAGGTGPLAPFWEAVSALDPAVEGESQLPGSHAGDLASLFEAASLRDVDETALVVGVEHPTFEEWWEPFTLGVGPAGSYVAGLTCEGRRQLRERCRQTLPSAPFVLTARAWSARGLVGH